MNNNQLEGLQCRWKKARQRLIRKVSRSNLGRSAPTLMALYILSLPEEVDVEHLI